MALRDEIRTWVLIQCKSQRAAARHFGLSRNTVAKLPALSQRPMVLAEMGGRLGSWTSCRAHSARLQRERCVGLGPRIGFTSHSQSLLCRSSCQRRNGLLIACTKFTTSDLEGATFAGATLTGTDFSRSDLTGVSFDEQTLEDVKFDSVSLTETSYRNATLRHVSFHYTDVKHAIFDGAKMDKVTYALLKSAEATLHDITVL